MTFERSQSHLTSLWVSDNAVAAPSIQITTHTFHAGCMLFVTQQCVHAHYNWLYSMIQIVQ